MKMKLEAKRKKREKKEKKERKKHRKHKRNKDEKRKSENYVEDKMRKRHKKKKHKSIKDSEGKGDVGDVIKKTDSADIQHGAENVENEAVSDILQILNERISKDGETLTAKTEKVLNHKRDTLEKGVRVESELIDVKTDMASATASSMNDKGPLGMENECKEEFMETDAHENNIDPNCDNHTEKEAKLIKDNKPGKENIKMHELSKIVDNNDEQTLNDKHELETDITDRMTVKVKASHREKGKDKVKREDASERRKSRDKEKKDGINDSDIEIIEVRHSKRKHRSRSERHRSIIISSESESETESGEISESESSSSDTESMTHLSQDSSSDSDTSDSTSEDDMDDKHDKHGTNLFLSFTILSAYVVTCTDQLGKKPSKLLSCQPRVTVMSFFVYNVIRDLESIDHMCINPIRRIGLIHTWYIDLHMLKWSVPVNTSLNNCKHNMTSLSLLAGGTVHIDLFFSINQYTNYSDIHRLLL